jgi:hypothetical protein
MCTGFSHAVVVGTSAMTCSFLERHMAFIVPGSLIGRLTAEVASERPRPFIYLTIP